MAWHTQLITDLEAGCCLLKDILQRPPFTGSESQLQQTCCSVANVNIHNQKYILYTYANWSTDNFEMGTELWLSCPLDFHKMSQKMNAGPESGSLCGIPCCQSGVSQQALVASTPRIKVNSVACVPLLLQGQVTPLCEMPTRLQTSTFTFSFLFFFFDLNKLFSWASTTENTEVKSRYDTGSCLVHSKTLLELLPQQQQQPSVECITSWTRITCQTRCFESQL